VAGETAMDTMAACPTLRVVELETAPNVAVIVVVPCAALVAKPTVSVLMTAVDTEEELHDTVAVMFFELPSLYVPLARNCCAVPKAIVGACGVIAIDTNAAGLTTRVAVLLTPAKEMPMVVGPVPTLLVNP
jgi:hypothetical protein